MNLESEEEQDQEMDSYQNIENSQLSSKQDTISNNSTTKKMLLKGYKGVVYDYLFQRVNVFDAFQKKRQEQLHQQKKQVYKMSSDQKRELRKHHWNHNNYSMRQDSPDRQKMYNSRSFASKNQESLDFTSKKEPSDKRSMRQIYNSIGTNEALTPKQSDYRPWNFPVEPIKKNENNIRNKDYDRERQRVKNPMVSRLYPLKEIDLQGLRPGQKISVKNFKKQFENSSNYQSRNLSEHSNYSIIEDKEISKSKDISKKTISMSKNKTSLNKPLKKIGRAHV